MRVAILDDYQSAAMQFPCWRDIGAQFEVVSFPDHVSTENDLVRRLENFDAVSRMRERTSLSRNVLSALPRLKLVLCTGMRNADSIDLKAAEDLGITVCSTETFGTPTLEITWGLLLNLFRRIDTEMASLRAGGWQTNLGSTLEGKTLGILGLGRYGGRVAVTARHFGMNVIAWSPNLTQERASPFNALAVTKDELFTRSDAIKIHMPEGPRSLGIVGAAEIGKMKRTAFLINTSRAALIDEDALFEALQAERIGGLGVDVYHEEPLASDHPFRRLPNVVATPHIGYVTRENYEIMFGQTVENLKAFAEGAPMRVLTCEAATLSIPGAG